MSLIDQINSKPTYTKLTMDSLQKLISEIFHQDPPQPMVMMTGQGGVKDYIKEWCKQLNLEYNWKNLRKLYTGLRKSGNIKRWVSGKHGRGYEISTL